MNANMSDFTKARLREENRCLKLHIKLSETQQADVEPIINVERRCVEATCQDVECFSTLSVFCLHSSCCTV